MIKDPLLEFIDGMTRWLNEDFGRPIEGGRQGAGGEKKSNKRRERLNNWQ